MQGALVLSGGVTGWNYGHGGTVSCVGNAHGSGVWEEHILFS